MKMIKTYPIYSISASYIQDDTSDKNDEWYNKRREGLPIGRIKGNSHYYNRMFRKRPCLQILQKEYETIFLSNLNSSKDYPIINPTDLVITIRLSHWEEWCLTWFAHFIFDNGQSDVEILESFEKYVWRIQRQNQDEGYRDDEGYWQEPYCLMGAEDRWRWRSASTNGDNNQDPDKYPPPCRCDGCKERGVIAINH